MTDPETTEDLLKTYEKMFAYRYTDEDPDYVQTSSKPIPPCPCVMGYYTRSRQQSDNRRGNWNDRGRDNYPGRDNYQGRGNSPYDRRRHGDGGGRWRDQDRHRDRDYTQRHQTY